MSVSEGKNLNQASYECSEAITEHTFVQLDTTNSTANKTIAKVATAVTDIILGIAATTTTASGQAVVVNKVGSHCYLTVKGDGTAITAGCALTPMAGGLGIKTTTAGDNIGAVALCAATGASDEIPVEVVSPYMNPDS